jgi:hypothetical protein
MPEMKGWSTDSMDDLLQHSIWTMLKRAYLKEEDKVRHSVSNISHEENDTTVEWVENVEEV